MTDRQGMLLQRFIQHFERLTRVGLQWLPMPADVVFTLDEEQVIIDVVDRQ